ncbi:MAG: hypothetical protein IAG13_09775, partial [Deltaproteobacteria bacterium]|nr:hypothetical protein [Nannocystaceae bacterium]
RANDHAAREPDPTPPAAPAASWDSLPEEYVGKIIRDQLLPVAEACYEDIADKGTKGALTLSVAVLADEELGGVIDRVYIARDGTTLEGELTECVRQAAYDMQFDPPEQGQGGKEFDVTLDFSQSEPPPA